MMKKRIFWDVIWGLLAAISLVVTLSSWKNEVVPLVGAIACFVFVVIGMIRMRRQ